MQHCLDFCSLISSQNELVADLEWSVLNCCLFEATNFFKLWPAGYHALHLLTVVGTACQTELSWLQQSVHAASGLLRDHNFECL